MSKKSLLVLVTMSLLVFSVLLYAQGTQRGKKLTVDVVTDDPTFSFVDIDGSTDPTPGEPFIIEGDIFAEGTVFVSPPVGHFVCRGFFIAPQADGDVTIVHQSFEINGRGTIHIEGNEDGAVPGVVGFHRAIVGATGDFKGSGEATVVPMPGLGGGAFSFRITFNFRD